MKGRLLFWTCTTVLALSSDALPQSVDASPALTQRALRKKKFKGPATAAIQRGIAWLLAHQDQDGRWSSVQFMKHDPEDDRCDGAGTAGFDIGVTGLALLALLAQADPEHNAAIDRGADWLCGLVDASSGRIESEAFDFIYSQAITTTALAEAGAMRDNARYRETAKKALAYIESHHTPGGGFGYLLQAKKNDSSVLSWCVAAYFACSNAGIALPAVQSLTESLTWLDGCTDEYGHVGYTSKEEGSSRKDEKHIRKFPIEATETLTAAALHARLMTGLPVDSAAATRSISLMLSKAPDWSRSRRDYYYWMHGSMALSQLADDPRHQQWRAAVERALLPNQHKDGSSAGSWDPVSVWGDVGGRVYSTAAAVLALSSSYHCGTFSPVAELRSHKPLRRLHSPWSKGQMGRVATTMDKIVVAELTPAQVAALRRARWALELSAGRESALLSSLKKLPGERLLFRFLRLDELVERWQGHALGKRAEKSLAKLLESPTAKLEYDAYQALAAVRPKYEKARKGRESKRRSMHRTLTRLAAKYKGTLASKRMIVLAGELL